MTNTDQSERWIMAGGLIALGCSFAALSTVLGATAFDHMLASANMCAPGAEHCLACISALASLTAALVAGSAGLSLLRPRTSQSEYRTKA